MRIVVVGLGVMGLSAARELAVRGHDVVALDRSDVGNRWASSSGATRIYRLAHPEPPMVRLALRNHELWEALERDAGRPLRLRRGLVWRGGLAEQVASALAAAGVDHELLDERRQAELFPELRWRADAAALWQPDAGVVLADEALRATAALCERAGGRLQTGTTVLDIVQRASGVQVVADAAGQRVTLDADRVVLTVGPWAGAMLDGLDVRVSLTPFLEQITYVRGGDDVPWASRPCLVDVPAEAGSFGFYAMPTPGLGFKVGIDDPIGRFDPEETSRAPVAEREREAVERVRLELPAFDATPIRSEVCAWTESDDDLFVLDRVGDVVFGCGDSGQGFKFLPMFGQVLSDLVEGRPVSEDVAALGLGRFAAEEPTL